MNFLHWYATHGIASPKTGKVKPFLGGGRRPKGEEHRRVRPSVYYRVPLYEDSHMSLEGDTALCGRPLEVDPLWWVDSGWEGALGGWFLIVDTRKSGKCSACQTCHKEIIARGEMPVITYKSPFVGADHKQAQNIAAADRIRLNSLAAVVLRAFPGSEVVDV